MFDVGYDEMLLVLLLALLLLGPKNLPLVSRTLGKLLGEIRRMGWEFTSALQDEVEELERQEKAEHKEKGSKEKPSDNPSSNEDTQNGEKKEFPSHEVADAAPPVRITSDKPDFSNTGKTK